MTVRILQGDCRDVLKTLPDESVHCVVTSPPYWSLRDYGVSGQIGLEDSPQEYVEKMISVFAEVRRVLRADGTLWLNLGDSYSGSGPSGASYQSATTKAREGQRRDGAFAISGTLAARGLTYAEKKPIPAPGLKPKDLVGIPWRVALALQEAGWWLRQDIIWSKPNPMPESVRDRCTKAHEYLFLLAKSERYYFDADAIKEDSVTMDPRRPYGSEGSWQLDGRPTEQRPNGKLRKRNDPVGGKSHKERGQHSEGGVVSEYTHRNKRSVWTINTQPYSGAHFATFPPDLIEPCILAGCPAGGTVLDPFGGAGTTGLVADRAGRDAILIELNPEYADIARKRIKGDAPLFAEVA